MRDHLTKDTVWDIVHAETTTKHWSVLEYTPKEGRAEYEHSS